MMAPETVVTVEHGKPQGTVQSTDPALSWLTINVDYFKTPPGILKLIQLLFGIICMALASPAMLSGTHWFLFVVVTSFISTLIWSFVYLLGIKEALRVPINWLLTELFNTTIATVLYTIAFIVQLSVWTPPYSFYRASNLTAGCFGLFNTLAYAAGVFYLYQEHKAAGPMQVS